MNYFPCSVPSYFIIQVICQQKPQDCQIFFNGILNTATPIRKDFLSKFIKQFKKGNFPYYFFPGLLLLNFSGEVWRGNPKSGSFLPF
jgi:hypothetical protein